MSAFLGPIHTWLFNKIKIQNELTDHLLDYAVQNYKNSELGKLTDKRYGKLEVGELQDIVDESNIHGWLQERVSLVENRLAYVVTELVNNYEGSMSAIRAIAEKTGEQHRVLAAESAKEAWKKVEDTVLDGMPCDMVNKITEQSDTEGRYEVVNPIHEKYWTMIGADVESFYEIKTSLIQGMLKETGYQYERCSETSWRIYGED